MAHCIERSGPFGSLRGLLLDDREDVASGEEQVLLTVVLHLGAAVLAVDDDVADRDVEGDALVAILIETAGSDGQDLALLGLLLGGVGDDEARSSGLLGVEGLDQDAVLERLDGDRHVYILHRCRWAALTDGARMGLVLAGRTVLRVLLLAVPGGECQMKQYARISTPSS